MKKLLLVALLATGVSAASFAQGGGRPQQTPAQQLERLKTQVTGITADQESKLTAIFTAQAKSMDSLRTASGDDRQAMFGKMQPLRAAYTAKIKAALTTEQATAYQKALDEQQARFGGQGGGAPRN